MVKLNPDIKWMNVYVFGPKHTNEGSFRLIIIPVPWNGEGENLNLIAKQRKRAELSHQ